MVLAVEAGVGVRKAARNRVVVDVARGEVVRAAALQGGAQEQRAGVVLGIDAAEGEIAAAVAEIEVDRAAAVAHADEGAEPQVGPQPQVAAEHAAIELVGGMQQRTIGLLHAAAGKAARPHRAAVPVDHGRVLEHHALVRIGGKSGDRGEDLLDAGRGIGRGKGERRAACWRQA